MQQLKTLDTQLFLYLNSIHFDWLDLIMEVITRRETWFPAYLILVIWLIVRNRKEAAFQILTILLAVLISDQICSSFLKPMVARLRPCHEPSLQGLIHLVTDCGGQFGFCSSHAANGFALATSLWLFFGKNIYTISLFVWAIIISYSRIYVGVHYPLDILSGAILGSLFAYLSFFAITRVKKVYFS
ncbi:MAG: phosphatase PAP2 family protein [Bacteroidota bacterium]